MEGFAGGELKHGVISLIEPKTPCLIFVSSKQEQQNTISNAIELKARGGFIIGISSTNHPVFDQWIGYPECGTAEIIIQAIIAQLLTYYMATYKNLNPDKPRNLAKSVTVK